MSLTYPPQAGAAFPAVVGTNDRFYRTDLGFECYFDGTRWVTTQVFQADFIASQGYLLSATDTHYMPLPYPNVYDKWLINAELSFYVNGGTALDGSHNWVGTLTKGGVAGNSSLGDAIGGGVSFSINTGTLTVVRIATPVAIGALLGIDRGWLRVAWVKTGTPGNTLAILTVNYRLVIT